jgi:hypothetical protein
LAHSPVKIGGYADAKFAKRVYSQLHREIAPGADRATCQATIGAQVSKVTTQPRLFKESKREAEQEVRGSWVVIFE